MCVRKGREGLLEGGVPASRKDCAINYFTFPTVILTNHLEMIQTLNWRTWISHSHLISYELTTVCLGAGIETRKTAKRDSHLEVVFTLILKFLACRSAKTRLENKKSPFQPFSTFPKLEKRICLKKGQHTLNATLRTVVTKWVRK